MTEPIRVLIADDHAVMRRGLRLFLDLQEDLEVVGEAEDGGRAAEEAAAQRADVIVMDLSMPGLDGIHGTKLIQDGSPGSKVLLLSSFVDERVLPALNAGADGYLTKDSSPEQLAEAIRSVHRGEPVFCPEALRQLTRELAARRGRPEGTVTFLFTDIEGSTSVLEKLGEGQARKLFREHDAMLRDALEEHAGFEIEHEGDSFMVAFSGARHAVRCAVEMQKALAGHPLRVRAGLNTGDVIAEEAGYFGRTVFLAARVAGQARGGQVLVSDVTRALAGDLPEVRFEDRGEHALKGLAGKHRLWEAAWQS